MINRVFKCVFVCLLFFISPVSFALSRLMPKTVEDREGFVSQAPFQPCSDFILVKGRATQNTTLWLLGESHLKRKKTIACVEELTKKILKHNIYVEGIPAGKKIPCKQIEIAERSGRQCIGWDNIKAHQKMESFFPHKIVNLSIRLLRNIYDEYHKSDQDMDEIVENYINNNLQAQRAGDNDQSIVSSLKKVQTFFSKKRIAGLSYAAIFESETIEIMNPDPEITPQLKKVLRTQNKIRNAGMVKILQDLPGGLFSIVVAGSSHLIVSDEDDLGAAAYVQSELEKGKHQNRYAVLTARN